MARIKWLGSALIDVGELADVIASNNPEAAARVILRIRAVISTLSEMPDAGRLGRVEGTRELVISGTPYVAVYRLRDKIVEILAVRHGAREWLEAF